MIDSKEKLKEYLKIEEKINRENGYKGKIHSFITQCEVGKIQKYVEVLRRDEYYTNTNKNLLTKALAVYYRRLHNKIGVELGISIPINTFNEGLTIYHSQGIIVHKDVRSGKYCKLHGLTCIGNNGREVNGRNTPILGDYIDIGVGAIIIGPITLANEIKIAAGAVICKSCEKEHSVLMGAQQLKE